METLQFACKAIIKNIKPKFQIPNNVNSVEIWNFLIWNFIVYTFYLRQKDHAKILSAFHVLIALIMLYDFINTPKLQTRDSIFSAIYLIGAIFLIIAAFFSKPLRIDFQKNLSLLLYECLLISGGIIYYWAKSLLYITFAHAFLAGAILLFWIYLFQKRNGEKIIISFQRIVIPAFIGSRIIEWKQLSNVVKKDDLLTLDFKSNKIIQVEVSRAEGSEEEFNRFCQRQLAAQN